MTEDRVDWHLWNWAQYHRRSRARPQGYPNASTGLHNYTSGLDFDAECDWIDKRCAIATDAAVDDLPALERMAVYAKHLEGLWGLPEPALGLYYRSAIGMLGKRLDRRGVV